MVEAGDTVSQTLKKEFGEEAMNSLECSPEQVSLFCIFRFEICFLIEKEKNEFEEKKKISKVRK
jgi:hypothetical protein